MRQQARELLEQVQRFKTNQTDRPVAAQKPMRHEAPPVGSKPVTQAQGSKGISRKPVVGKPVQHKELAGAVAGNGKDRRSSGDKFEEF
jgi:hypothetical protein